MWLKTLILILFIYWISQRFRRIFSAIDQDRGAGQGDQTHTRSSGEKSDQIIPDDKGEYIDYEEVD